MNRLLALTDFSAAADASLRYAATLAGDCSLPLTVVHRYTIPLPMPFGGPDEALMMAPVPLVEIRTAAEEQLTAAIARLREAFPELPLQSRLMAATMAGEPDLDGPLAETDHTLVVPNDAAASEEASWLNTDVTSILRGAHRTVIAVPEAAVYRPVRNIALALDPATPTASVPVAPLLTWLRTTGASLHVVRVGDATKEWDAALVASLEAVAPQYHQVTDAADVESGLLHVVEALAIDWLALTPQDHGFFGGLFHKSHMQSLARKCPVPLVALHMAP